MIFLRLHMTILLANVLLFCKNLLSFRLSTLQQLGRNFELSAKVNRPSPQGKGSIEKYLQMKELLRLKNEGASYDELKEASINGTSTGIKWKEQAALTSIDGATGPGYRKFVGKKGTLDQRLRAVIAYKRSNAAAAESVALGESPGLTIEEQIELENMMESDEGDEDISDDEELQYESLILQAIERNKLSEVKRNLAVDQRLQSRERYSDKKLNNSSTETVVVTDSEEITDSNNLNVNKTVSKEDLYTPARHSWGVFQRPRDISKSYGGGRTISKAEMDRLDEEYEQQQKAKSDIQKVILTESQQKELKNTPLIKDALGRSRGFMAAGNRVAAVKVLESVQDMLSWQSGFAIVKN